MDVSTRNGAVAATAVFTALQIAATGWCLWLKSSRAAGYLRFLAILPFALYGGFSIQMSFKQRYGPNGATSRLGPVWLSQGIHGLAGILLVPWAIIGVYVVQKSRKRQLSSSAYDWDERRPSSSSFYLALVDACFAAAIITATVFGARFTPWDYSRCDRYRVYNTWPLKGAGRIDNCRQMLTSQIMAVLVLLVLCAQFVLIVPVIALPSAFRAPIFYLCRALRFRRTKYHQQQPPGWHASEKTPLALSEKPSLETVFRDDAIATSLARYLHFDDVTSVSRTSRAMRRAVFTPMPDARTIRLDMLCEATCSDTGTPKGECWACAKIICEGCHSPRSRLPEPRTVSHLTKCHALCTRCYIRRPSAYPAPFVGSWNPDDLSSQHAAACKIRTKTLLVGPVSICPSCAKLTDQEVVRVREERDAASMRMALMRRMRCRRCERALPRGRRRWWVCGVDYHECHWAGHEAP
ncbi:hypothetical protein JDV02_003365 [Purpureocillium takamizusanense]|uniref:Uncharacterized protein n=1 Tax=Purpureocillium takamizusanense TaxID=2060973 RepID=A0A9Q8V8S4_9HYPO|nr:uncharacterized protein JDV02_003365 [Purpureocillium takamizusanense]UNI16983.1 hypothetical protein JDV02_003365 [Purpureocillium takamizusanense]